MLGYNYIVSNIKHFYFENLFQENLIGAYIFLKYEVIFTEINKIMGLKYFLCILEYSAMIQFSRIRMNNKKFKISNRTPFKRILFVT